jgi:formamidopyrimidine-DNA glycosylase
LAGAVKKEQIAALVKAIKQVLKDAIAAGGSTLRDHAQATGDPGSFQHRFRVYDREGLACKNTSVKCSGKVKRIVQGGRSTFYCPACQK